MMLRYSTPGHAPVLRDLGPSQARMHGALAASGGYSLGGGPSREPMPA
jgi:hypothetical protein